MRTQDLSDTVNNDIPEAQPKPMVKPDDQAGVADDVAEPIDPPWDPLPRVALTIARADAMADPFDEPGEQSAGSRIKATSEAHPLDQPRALAPVKPAKPRWGGGAGSRDEADILRIVDELDDTTGAND